MNGGQRHTGYVTRTERLERKGWHEKQLNMNDILPLFSLYFEYISNRKKLQSASNNIMTQLFFDYPEGTGTILYKYFYLFLIYTLLSSQRRTDYLLWFTCRFTFSIFYFFRIPQCRVEMCIIVVTRQQSTSCLQWFSHDFIICLCQFTEENRVKSHVKQQLKNNENRNFKMKASLKKKKPFIAFNFAINSTINFEVIPDILILQNYYDLLAINCVF